MTLNQPYGTVIASYQDNNVQLVEFNLDDLIDSPHLIFVDLAWNMSLSQPVGDYRLFVHLYDDRNQPPLAQWDNYLGNMPLGNWQNALLFNRPDEIFLTIEDLPAGTYQLAIGFYNPNDPTDRLIPESDVYEVTPDGRLWLGEVEIE